MTELVQKTTALGKTVGVISVALAIVGFAFEQSYFYGFGLQSLDSLKLQHYIYSGFLHFGTFFIVLVILGMVTRFFSSEISEDPSAATEKFKKIDDKTAIWIARFGIILAFLYFLFSWVEMSLLESPIAAGFGWFITFCIIGSNYPYLIKCPPHARFTAVDVFILALLLNFSGFGIGMAHLHLFSSKKGNDPIVRDDGITKIIHSEKGFEVMPKKITLPIPLLRVLSDGKDGNPEG